MMIFLCFAVGWIQIFSPKKILLIVKNEHISKAFKLILSHKLYLSKFDYSININTINRAILLSLM